GGVHAPTGAGTGNRGFLDLLQLDIGNLASGMAADGFEHRDDVGVVLARPDGATIDEDGGAVETGNAHHAAGHVLVTAADGDDAVMAHAAGHGLNGICNDLAGDERVL